MVQDLIGKFSDSAYLGQSLPVGLFLGFPVLNDLQPVAVLTDRLNPYSIMAIDHATPEDGRRDMPFPGCPQAHNKTGAPHFRFVLHNGRHHLGIKKRRGLDRIFHREVGTDQ